MVLVDGVAEAGDGPTRTLALDPGLRRFEVRASDGRSDRFELGLASGTPAAHAVRLAPATEVSTPRVSNAQAQAAFEHGRRSLLERRYDDAARAFQDAARLDPTPGTWRWLGVTLRSMGRYTESLAAFERYFAAPEEDVTEEQFAQMRVAVAEMRRALARLTVIARPAGATLLIDARPRPMGAAEVTVDPGAHVVELRADGHRPHRQEVELRPGEQLTVVAHLLVIAGRIIVEPSVVGAAVEIDGRAAGRGRVEQEAAPGEHMVEIRAADHEPLRRAVRVVAGGATRFDATLVRRGRPGWVAPALIVGGAVAVGGAVIAGVAYLARGTAAPTPDAWATYQELLTVR